MKHKILCVFMALAVCVFTYADVITGTVKDANGEPLIGVSVVIKGSATGTITDYDGKYSVEAEANSQLVFSYVGHITKEVNVASRSVVDVTLDEDTKTLDDVVVVGYATQRKANLTGAVASVNVQDQLEGRPISNLTQGLQGATPGLTITSTSGRLGDASTFKIRGQVGSLNNTDAGPLVLLNGVEISDMSLVNPDDIESISVLKDAASSSIYGARAAFGVILIQTKDASKMQDKFTVSYNNNFSWSRPTVVPKALKAWENAAMSLEAYRSTPGVAADASFNGSWIGLSVDDEFVRRAKEWDDLYGDKNLGNEMILDRDFYLVGQKPYFIRFFDPMAMYFKKDAFANQHNISVDATSGKTNYHVSLGFMDQKGLLKLNTNDQKRYTANFKTSTALSDYVKIRTELLYSHTDLTIPYYSSTSAGEMYQFLRWPSYMPYGTYKVTDEDVAKYPFLAAYQDGEAHPFHNAATELEAGYTKDTKKDYMRVSLGTTFVLGIPDLTLDIDYTFNLDNTNYSGSGGTTGKWWQFWSTPLTLLDDGWNDTHKRVAKYAYYNRYHAGNAVLRYNHTWNDDHAFSAFLGMNIEHKTIEYNYVQAGKLFDFNLPELNLTDGSYYKVNGSHSTWAVMGFFARVNYAFRNKYLLELNGRYDGSSRFPTDQQWGFFPSGSLGWIASEESFWEPLKPWWSFAKIRASYGSIGNQNLSANLFRALLTQSNTNWVYNGQVQNGYNLPTTLRNGFTWENIKTLDIGADFRFFNDDFGVTFDWYQRVNDGMVVAGTEVPSTYGATSPRENAGELRTRGWELSVDYRHRFSNGLGITASAGVADATTKVMKYPTKASSVISQSGTQFSALYEGGTVGDIYGFETDRLFQVEDFDIDANGNYVLKPGIPTQTDFEKTSADNPYTFQPGDVKYKDLDGDGKITWGEKTYENHGDLKVIGNTSPHYEYNFKVGVDWYGVDLSLFFQGVGKRDYWAGGYIQQPNFTPGHAVWFEHQTDYWRPDNTGAFYPRLTNINQKTGLDKSAFNFLTQSRYLLDYSYLRWKNLTIGYSLPKQILEKIHFQKMRIYFSAENLATMDNLGKMPLDPEYGEVSDNSGSMGYGANYPYSKSFSFGLQVTF